jgi:hypothetical protein
VPRQPRNNLQPLAFGARGALPEGFRPLGQYRSKPAPAPQDASSASAEAHAALHRGDDYGRVHVLWLRLEIEAGSIAAARLCQLAAEGHRGPMTVSVGKNGFEVTR